MKGFIDFIRSQSIIGLAIAFVLGKAVADVVTSLINDIVSPLLGIIFGKTSGLASLSLKVMSANITYGKFIVISINFLVIAFVIYFIVKKLGLDKLDKPKQ